MADQKRYVIVVDFYVYAENESDAINQGNNVCYKINHIEDHKAEVQVVSESIFGSIGKGKEVFKK